MTKTKRTQYVTPVGTALYARLKTPSVQYDEDGRYLVTLLLADEDAQPFIQLIEDTATTFFNETLTKKTLNRSSTPYEPYVNKETNNAEGYVFRFYLRARVTPEGKPSFTQRPALFDATAKPINEDIWAGSRLRVSAEIHPWETKLGWGVSLWVRAVQVIHLVSGQNYSATDGTTYGFSEEEGYESFPTESLSENHDPNDDIPF